MFFLIQMLEILLNVFDVTKDAHKDHMRLRRKKIIYW